MIYTDGATGKSYAKRFNVTGVTRDKEYNLIKENDKSEVHHFTANANGEAEVVSITLKPSSSAKKKQFEFHFEELDIKGRSGVGIQVTKYPIKAINIKEAGKSTISGKKIWLDEQFGRLNIDEKGTFIDSFGAEDKIIIFYRDGYYEIIDQDLSRKLDAEKIIGIQKFDPEKIITAVYVDMEKKQFTVKRFKIETTTLNNKFLFIKEGEGNYLETITTEEDPILTVEKGRGSQVRKIKYKIGKNVEVTGWKTVGTRLEDYIKSIKMYWVERRNVNPQTELFE